VYDMLGNSSSREFYVFNNGTDDTVSTAPPPLPSRIRSFFSGLLAPESRTSRRSAGQNTASVSGTRRAAVPEPSSGPANRRIDFSSSRLSYTPTEASLASVPSSRARTPVRSVPSNRVRDEQPKQRVREVISPETGALPEGIPIAEGTELSGDLDRLENSMSGPEFTGLDDGSPLVGLNTGGTAASGGEGPAQGGQPRGPDRSDSGNHRNLTACIMPAEAGSDKRKGRARIRPHHGDVL
jgi:hypothetical protein